jgi:hypothetical protein
MSSLKITSALTGKTTAYVNNPFIGKGNLTTKHISWKIYATTAKKTFVLNYEYPSADMALRKINTVMKHGTINTRFWTDITPPTK